MEKLGKVWRIGFHSSLKELVNKYVASLAANFYSSKEHAAKVPLMESEEFKKAMAFMDSFVIEDLSSEVPVDEDGKAQGLGGDGILGLLMREGATRVARGLGTR